MTGPEVQNWLKEYLGLTLGLPAAEIDLNKDLGYWGLDSVDAVLMAGEMEEAFEIEIDPAAFLHHLTLESMGASLQERLAHRQRLVASENQ